MSKAKATRVIIKLKHPHCYRGIQYAEDVVSGKIAAGKYIIGACERFLTDLDNDKAKFYFDADAAEKYLRNVQNFHHVEGHWASPTIKYEPWQCWVWMNIMGFKMKDTGFRRFRVVHLEVARGNAKSTMASQAALYFLALDNPNGIHYLSECIVVHYPHRNILWAEHMEIVSTIIKP